MKYYCSVMEQKYLAMLHLYLMPLFLQVKISLQVCHILIYFFLMFLSQFLVLLVKFGEQVCHLLALFVGKIKVFLHSFNPVFRCAWMMSLFARFRTTVTFVLFATSVVALCTCGCSKSNDKHCRHK